MFDTDNWQNLFTMLNTPREINKDTLKFSHLLEAESAMLGKAAELKELAARAQGEVTLREAI